jgi:FOG: FHA domain
MPGFSRRTVRWIVEDLGSTNGTYLDRQKVTRPMPVPGGRADPHR